MVYSSSRLPQNRPAGIRAFPLESKLASHTDWGMLASMGVLAFN
jgi:hypothetical protein